MSFDPDGDMIAAFRWQIDLKPPGSTAVLSDPEAVTPSLTADVQGEYRISLVVFDGQLWSLPDEVVLSAAVTGDFDGDDDVDAADLEAFEDCGSAPGVPPAAGCDTADLDHDNDVDQTDFAVFQRCYSGENKPADPNCAE